MRAAMEGKEYALGEQKVTSASSLPDGLPPALRVGITIKRTEVYGGAALASGTVPGPLGIAELADEKPGERLGRAKRGIEDTVPAVIEGVKKTLPRPEPTPQEKPQAPEPAWPETPRAADAQGAPPAGIQPAEYSARHQYAGDPEPPPTACPHQDARGPESSGACAHQRCPLESRQRGSYPLQV